MAGRFKITDAPNGELTSPAGTEGVPVTGSEYATLNTIADWIRTKVQTLTGKTINLTDNTLTGTTAQFNTALSDGNFATLAGAETLSGPKTLTAPVIADFTAAQHDHGDADDGGTLAEGALALTDVTTNDASTTKHGFLKKLSNVSTEYMSGTGVWSTPAGGGSVATDAIFDALGDLAVGTGANTAAKLTVGTDGKVLTANSGEPTGLEWVTPGAGTNVATDTIFDALGDLAVGTGANTAAKLTAGTDGFILSANSGEATGLEWIANSGGGVTDAEYLTSASHGSLSAELVIPGLAGSADRKAFAGGGTSEEYDTSTTGLTFNSAPDTVDSDTTIPSHLYVRATTNAEYIGTKAFAPAGAFDARTKLLLGNGVTNSASVGLHVGDSDDSDRLLMNFNSNPSTQNFNLAGYTYTGATYTQRGSTWNVPGNEIYLRITRDGSNNCSFYFSVNGILWQLVATQSFTFTVANLGFRITQAAALTHECAADWLRTDV